MQIVSLGDSLHEIAKPVVLEEQEKYRQFVHSVVNVE